MVEACASWFAVADFHALQVSCSGLRFVVCFAGGCSWFVFVVYGAEVLVVVVRFVIVVYGAVVLVVVERLQIAACSVQHK